MEIIGRRSSHFTRVVRILAEELDIACEFTPIYSLLSAKAHKFADNPALKLPILRDGEETIYGSRNICRFLWRHSDGRKRVFWPEQAESALLMNAHELLAHAMTAQVDVILHEIVEERPPDRRSIKRRQSLDNCLAWLDCHFDEVFGLLPERDLSLFEIELFCLIAHLPFRNPVNLDEMPKLQAYERAFGQRRSARNTPYAFDREP
jgi:glutathione S-transferase